MSELRWLSVLIVVAAGCGGSSRTTPDAGGGDDAWAAPSEDAWTPPPGEDAWTAPLVDAWTAPGTDAATGSGACTDSADQTVAMGATFSNDLGNCARTHFAEPGRMTCIQGLGLSSACAMCFDAEVGCTASNCTFQCAGGDSPGCTTCRANNCDPAFAACAGFTP